MKRALSSVLPLLALAVVLAAALPSPAVANGCTASLSCNNSCSEDVTCSPPYPPCELVCFAPSQTVSCSGASTCSVGTSSVTCDGVTKSCPTASQCHAGTTSVSCGSITRVCTHNCPL
jgi:hypothetical protein